MRTKVGPIYAIQQGGRIAPKTGRLIKGDDTKNVTDNVTEMPCSDAKFCKIIGLCK